MTRYKIGVVGGGFVGKATSGFKSTSDSLVVYDRLPDLCIPLGTTESDVYGCDLVFVCVPTPMSENGSCFLGDVNSVVHNLQKHGVKHIVLRSTVPVGTCAQLGCHFMPEFLTERRASRDFRETQEWVLGCEGSSASEVVEMVSQVLKSCQEESRVVSSRLAVMTTGEAEAVKYFRNCFLATKVGFCNELAQYCEAKGVDYGRVAKVAAGDPRIGLSHTDVPGPDGKRGFGGTCLPKDLSSLIVQFGDEPCPILRAVKKRNDTVDRPQKDWMNDRGRAVV